MLNPKDNTLIFTVNGGAGKNVLATAVVKAIKTNSPDTNIVVLTHYKDIWLYNPNVYRVYSYGSTPNFYNDFIKDNKNVKICALEPYTTNDYILKNKHLIEIWCNLVGVPYNNEKPELFFNQREAEYAVNFYGLNQAPYLLIQTNGGGQQDTKISWMRDIPLGMAQAVVNNFRDTHRIIHVRRDDQPALEGVQQFKGGLRDLMSLVRFSDKRLLIDSVCQHIASALNKPSTVLWVRNNPEVLGYAIHDNIVTKVEDEIDVFGDSVLEPYDITGNIYQCPFREGTKLFDFKQVLESVMNQGDKAVASVVDSPAVVSPDTETGTPVSDVADKKMEVVS